MMPVDPTANSEGATLRRDGPASSAEPAEALVDTGTPGPSEAPGARREGAAREAADAAELARQRDEYYELLLRKSAEFDNFRKRAERERREILEVAAGEVVKDLLPVLDDLERALAAASSASETEPFRQGVELIQRRLHDVLGKRGVAVIDPLGQPFDPHVHEAVATVAAGGDRRDGEIVEVFGRGYKLGDRLLRPALVKVATA